MENVNDLSWSKEMRGVNIFYPNGDSRGEARGCVSREREKERVRIAGVQACDTPGYKLADTCRYTLYG